ncbi:amidohydrolase family protein [Streptomyces griseocarneus]|uniref:amidohydrolase family protein n=1 Tax=Streptomyces griseocarneus TaxID=51201 RepID=UPI00167CE6B2|nr:amidohydrolase family protein [Streptomyces griseocarneus]MBZ6472400.1 amidohydrolase family protein [Streptomyces griseocarneus]GHG44962.1 amidohydrolase [Streptomyces griseocarneus]
MIIDAHSHVHDPVHSHIALLDEAGVDRAVLFGTRPHPERATDLASLRREMSVLGETINGRSDGPDSHEAARRELESACAAYPGRFIGFGKVRLDLPAQQIAADVEREIVGRGFAGIGELTPPPDEAGRIEPVLRAAADHGGLPVVVHGFAPTTAGDLATLAGLARRHPTVPLVISQLGGPNWLTAIELARETPNMYLDLSTANVIFAVKLAINEVPDRTLFGSDAPYGDPVLARATVERVTRPGALRDRVLGGTLAELLGL